MEIDTHNNGEAIKLAEEQMRLAAERTYLSWIRTGLTSVGIGLAIARFILYKRDLNQFTGQWIGQLLIIWGIGVFAFALLSYRKSYYKLKQFKTEKHPLLPLTIITAALILFSTILLIINMD
jgi:putative membrane protein